MHEIKEPHVARVALIKVRTACRNRRHGAQQDGRPPLKARERQIDRQLAQIDAELVRLIEAGACPALRDPDVHPRHRSRGATAMIVDMPELGKMTAKEAASLAGLAQVACQSGSWKGKARIFGGRSGLRTLPQRPGRAALPIEDWRWSRRSFLLRTGKRLAAPYPDRLSLPHDIDRPTSSVPDSLALAPATMRFAFAEAFGERPNVGYEVLLLDAP